MTIQKLSKIPEGDHTLLEKKLFSQIDELVNMVLLLKEENQLLKDEIAILKGQKPRPKIPPSNLEGTNKKGDPKDKTPRGKHPRKKKTSKLIIHEKQRIKLESIPEGAIYKGFNQFTVQDIIFKSHNIIYELERWQLTDGTYITAKLPQSTRGHYGPKLTSHILHQYYGCRVTEPLLLMQLHEIGVEISSGQLNNILSQNNENFHREKDELLLAGIEATNQIQVDDTGARHAGKNGYATIIGNQYFTSVETTYSKSRINFLQILRGNQPEYLVNQDTANYIETVKPSHWIRGYLLMRTSDNAMDLEEWKLFLHKANITSKNDIRLATEAALFSSLIKKGIPRNLGVHADDAGQFNAFVRSICWIHEERHYRKIIPTSEKMRQELNRIRDEIWKLYKGLQEYQTSSSEILKKKLEKEFDALFKQTTSSPTLNARLATSYAKKEELLRVLERPTTPLHNNRTETDAREFVVKRKVSGGTRSEEGRKSRDSFVSLKKTCIKLGINFLSYLQDRIEGTFEIPRLTEVIATQSSAQSAGP